MELHDTIEQALDKSLVFIDFVTAGIAGNLDILGTDLYVQNGLRSNNMYEQWAPITKFYGAVRLYSSVDNRFTDWTKVRELFPQKYVVDANFHENMIPASDLKGFGAGSLARGEGKPNSAFIILDDGQSLFTGDISLKEAPKHRMIMLYATAPIAVGEEIIVDRGEDINERIAAQSVQKYPGLTQGEYYSSEYFRLHYKEPFDELQKNKDTSSVREWVYEAFRAYYGISRPIVTALCIKAAHKGIVLGATKEYNDIMAVVEKDTILKWVFDLRIMCHEHYQLHKQQKWEWRNRMKKSIFIMAAEMYITFRAVPTLSLALRRTGAEHRKQNKKRLFIFLYRSTRSLAMYDHGTIWNYLVTVIFRMKSRYFENLSKLIGEDESVAKIRQYKPDSDSIKRMKILAGECRSIDIPRRDILENMNEFAKFTSVVANLAKALGRDVDVLNPLSQMKTMLSDIIRQKEVETIDDMLNSRRRTEVYGSNADLPKAVDELGNLKEIVGAIQIAYVAARQKSQLISKRSISGWFENEILKPLREGGTRGEENVCHDGGIKFSPRIPGFKYSTLEGQFFVNEEAEFVVLYLKYLYIFAHSISNGDYEAVELSRNTFEYLYEHIRWFVFNSVLIAPDDNFVKAQIQKVETIIKDKIV